jgi:hypothetical protein
MPQGDLFRHWYVNGNTNLAPAYLYQGKLYCFKCAQSIDLALLAMGVKSEDLPSKRDSSITVTEYAICAICGDGFNKKAAWSR